MSPTGFYDLFAYYWTRIICSIQVFALYLHRSDQSNMLYVKMNILVIDL